MIDSFVTQLPVEHTDPQYERYELLPGVSVGGFALYSGLNNLRPFGPVLAYCRDGSRFVQVDLAMSRGFVRFTLPWFSGNEARGATGLIASVKVTITFEVITLQHARSAMRFLKRFAVRSNGGGQHMTLVAKSIGMLAMNNSRKSCFFLQIQNVADKAGSGSLQPKLVLHDGTMPVSLEDVYVFLERTDTFLDRAAPVIGKLFSGLSKDAFLYLAKPGMQEIFKNITEEEAKLP
ncbi:hypothetical protein V5799_018645 [Amblyomma americanum]|uniref:Uncharacterized protein n=1 Tax=Amblyomma americanum TaxID=6943 RepID=A0AAQ4EYN8_AMBAM